MLYVSQNENKKLRTINIGIFEKYNNNSNICNWIDWIISE